MLGASNPRYPWQLPAEGTVADLGLGNGDTLVVRQGAAPPAAAEPPAAPPASGPVPGGAGGSGGLAGLYGMDEDEALARAIAASLEGEGGAGGSGATRALFPNAGRGGAATAVAPAGGAGSSQARPAARDAVAGTSVTDAPAGGPAPQSMAVAGGDGSCVVRRVIASDNSCLFNAVGYVMDRSRSRAAELRKVVASTVASDPVTFNDGFLGKDVEEYCRWIQDKDKWGGAIELFILAQHYRTEIAAFDIQTKRCDVYGQDKGYPDRCMLIYDGLHYDALAVAAFEGAPEELDVTLFRPDGREGAAIMGAAAKLVAATHEARQFTDTANFTLRCGVCQIGLKGQKEAAEHAQATGHCNFAEY
ncbi:hypothetical protein GPECTOR_20g439 [Gonium pectorale]|uniref:Ubiquitin thioesterase OTU n=1 Tax=Gonium pectorale TaxID=33097 RepID=A0A150GIE3_GONPE|nr:hypothetical protein GPECTOR_20g439 [Gonium pectorale]|eukprot:KXZ49583.1 hypothetical protein GPECTOR_20g439 [Gonium pectorale]